MASTTLNFSHLGIRKFDKDGDVYDAREGNHVANYATRYDNDENKKIPLDRLLKFRYGDKPFALKTLRAALTSLQDLGDRELVGDCYIDSSQVCMLGAFYVQYKPDADWVDGKDIRKFLIDAKHFNSRTVDALEAMNQYYAQENDDPSFHLARVKRWIKRQIARAEKYYAR